MYTAKQTDVSDIPGIRERECITQRLQGDAGERGNASRSPLYCYSLSVIFVLAKGLSAAATVHEGQFVHEDVVSAWTP